MLAPSTAAPREKAASALRPAKRVRPFKPQSFSFHAFDPDHGEYLTIASFCALLPALCYSRGLRDGFSSMPAVPTPEQRKAFDEWFKERYSRESAVLGAGSQSSSGSTQEKLVADRLRMVECLRFACPG
ncbi:MAG: hypothetical protein BJ554DRAFT_3804 [Olpidium bornovanus]|uniref:Uncharacterized protein n=1 Tax=Olpidium bornovanus TaxID=278681 RepID=A0A8H7ZNN2_9FUNG|nr:MAG: hypothetical protein BJ554DRAFT_3804 [Olpidium bornovanus]